MDPTQLRVFLAVAENLHFGRAAERLHLAQPYLSRTVRSLEDDLGAPLFTRTTRKVELTPAGQALIEPARAILALHSSAREMVRAAHHGESGTVRINFAGPSSHAMVGRLARAVRRQHPLIKLELQPGRYGTTAVRELVDNGTDLAIARFAAPPTGVRSRSIARETCVVVVPADHPLADASEVEFADLRDEPVVAFPEAYGSALRADARRAVPGRRLRADLRAGVPRYLDERRSRRRRRRPAHHDRHRRRPHTPGRGAGRSAHTEGATVLRLPPLATRRRRACTRTRPEDRGGASTDCGTLSESTRGLTVLDRSAMSRATRLTIPASTSSRAGAMSSDGSSDATSDGVDELRHRAVRPALAGPRFTPGGRDARAAVGENDVLAEGAVVL